MQPRQRRCGFHPAQRFCRAFSFCLLAVAGLAADAPGLDTLVLWQDGRVYTASTAVLWIAAALRFPWMLLGVFLLTPPALQDAVCRWVAGRRYRWFGRRDTCRAASPEERARFLDVWRRWREFFAENTCLYRPHRV